MADYTFNTPTGQTISRGLMVLYLNTGTADSPVWSAVGKRVADSSISMDWSTETSTDIFDETYTTGKKATRTQTFDPYPLDSGDAAMQHLWQLGVVDDNVNSLLNQDCLIVHLYAGASGSDAAFAERYSACAMLPTSLGGEGGGNLGMSLDVTYGGTRTKGSASKSGGTVTFTPEVSV